MPGPIQNSDQCAHIICIEAFSILEAFPDPWNAQSICDHTKAIYKKEVVKKLF